MAVTAFSSFPFAFLALLVCFLFFLEGTFSDDMQQELHSYTVELSSLLPAANCSYGHKVKGFRNNSLLKVVHKHGPCAKGKKKKIESNRNMEIILREDQNRVRAIQAKLNRKPSGNDDDAIATDSSTLPAKPGRLLGSGNYFVTVGLGTPKRYLSLVFDTGSDLTWTQCQPCAVQCYSQKEPIFDPSKSTSYSNISCSSASCSQLTSATGNTPSCAASTSTCVYGIQYGDSSFSVGFFSKDTLTIAPNEIFENFLFGCGENNQGLFSGIAGLLGLGRNPISFVQQTAQTYNRVFSYCLPSTTSSTGYLTFGAAASKNLQYTPISTIAAAPSFYGLKLIGISVGGKKLSIPYSVFSNSDALIDSGTVITRLPPGAYSPLRAAFRQAMSQYPIASAFQILDTCYDLSNYSKFTFPSIRFSFPGVELDLPPQGILVVASAKQYCLAFAGNQAASSFTIFGNVQQQTLEVSYDLNGGRIGFGTGACN